MTTPMPTGEQQAILDASQGGADLVIEAGAGTGKTSTLRLVAATQPAGAACTSPTTRPCRPDILWG